MRINNQLYIFNGWESSIDKVQFIIAVSSAISNEREVYICVSQGTAVIFFNICIDGILKIPDNDEMCPFFRGCMPCC